LSSALTVLTGLKHCATKKEIEITANKNNAIKFVFFINKSPLLLLLSANLKELLKTMKINISFLYIISCL